MRSLRRARWATCALVLVTCLPAIADHKKSLADCTSFGQSNKGDDAVVFTVNNACTIPLDCTLEWHVICAPDARSRRSDHPTVAKFALDHGSQETREASAAVCGDDAWVIHDIQWGCEPSKD